MGGILIKAFRKILILLLLTGCMSQGAPEIKGPSLLPPPQTEGPATVSVFLELKDDNGDTQLWMRVSKLRIKSGEKWLPINLARKELSSNGLARTGQFFLGRGGLPEGEYDRLRFTVDRAALESNGEKVLLALTEPNVEVPLDGRLSLGRGDSVSLFLTWDVQNSLQGIANLLPLMEAEIQSIPLTSDLAYVSCPEINTVYILRTDHNRVCGSIGVSGGPTNIEIEPDLNRFYVLSPEDASVGIFEFTSNRQLDRVGIPFSPDAAYMAMRPGGGPAYILDKNNNRLLGVDLFNGALTGRVGLGANPRYLFYAEDRNLLVASSAYGQEVSFIEPTDLNEVQKITTGGSPDGLLIFEDDLYIAEYSTGIVDVYDLAGNRIKKQIQVGWGPRRLIENNRHIYVSNFDGGSISVILPGQLSVSRDIRVDGKPFEMAVSTARQWLYVGDYQNGGIYLIDLSTNQMVKKIELGAIPYDLAVVED